jgi:hypothetical protein
VNDSKLIKASKDLLRVIIRRPHAYKFLAKHPTSGIPCLAIMNGKGRLLGGVRIPSADAALDLIGRIERGRKKVTKKRSF